MPTKMRWSMEVSGAMNFDALLNMIPNVASAGTEVKVYANMTIHEDSAMTLHEAGGLLRTSTGPMVNRVDPSARICMSIHPEGE